MSRGTYLYSNASYIVAVSMLEEVTGNAWEELVRDELFAPLAMRAAGFGTPGGGLAGSGA